MQLSGHGGPVLSLEFDRSGDFLASASSDGAIFVWNTKAGFSNDAVLADHKNAVLDLHWSKDSASLFSVSADRSLCVFDVERRERTHRFAKNAAIVNACAPSMTGPQVVATAGDDGMVKLWDPRAKTASREWECRFQMLSVAIAADGSRVFAAGLDDEIRVWDVRSGGDDPALVLSGHRDSVTGLALSPDGTRLLSNGMDNCVHCWDVQPFAAGSRLSKTFVGAVHTPEKNLLRCAWSADGRRVIAGSGDNMVNVWEAADAKLAYKLPGHLGSVNHAVFHPLEPVVASASSDKTVFVGEIDP